MRIIVGAVGLACKGAEPNQPTAPEQVKEVLAEQDCP